MWIFCMGCGANELLEEGSSKSFYYCGKCGIAFTNLPVPLRYPAHWPKAEPYEHDLILGHCCCGQHHTPKNLWVRDGILQYGLDDQYPVELIQFQHLPPKK